jgi:flagellar hook-associated protein 2
MTSSVDGLISGMSTSQVIGQLMQVESAGQSRLKTKVGSQQTVISALQSVNSKLASIKTAAHAMRQTTAWQLATATSSSTAVTATASTSAVSGQFTFDVIKLAKAQTSTATVAATGSIQDGTGVKIAVGATNYDITVTTDTAQGVVDAINAKGMDVKAALITTQQGSVLQLTLNRTGAANTFTVSGLKDSTGQPAAFTAISVAADAEIGVGVVGAGGYTIRSASNTFTNVLSNVTLTANKVENGVTVSVGRDVGGIANMVQAMVDAANGALTEIGTQAKYGDAKTKSGPLAANFMVRSLSGNILSAVSGGKTNFGSFKTLGVELDKTGKLTFDKTKFTAAYNADPTKIQDAVSTGLAQGFEELADKATKNIESAVQNGNSAVTLLNGQIESWDRRLATRQLALQRQFSNLEVSLGKLKSQSSWLSGQIAKLG